MSSLTPTSRATLFRVYLGLLGLLALTALSARWLTGPWSLPAALGIATAKLALIFFFFMQLRRQRGMIWIFAGAGFFWLGLAWVLTFSDYLSRGEIF